MGSCEPLWGWRGFSIPVQPLAPLVPDELCHSDSVCHRAKSTCWSHLFSWGPAAALPTLAETRLLCPPKPQGALPRTLSPWHDLCGLTIRRSRWFHFLLPQQRLCHRSHWVSPFISAYERWSLTARSFFKWSARKCFQEVEGKKVYTAVKQTKCQLPR